MNQREYNAKMEDLKTGDIVLIRGRVKRIIDKEEARSKEGKAARAAAIIRYRQNVIGVPFYTTGEGKPERAWTGAERYLVAGSPQNGLKNAFSQLGIDNACVLEQKNLLKHIGTLDKIDHEILLGLFWDQVRPHVQDS